MVAKVSSVKRWGASIGILVGTIGGIAGVAGAIYSTGQKSGDTTHRMENIEGKNSEQDKTIEEVKSHYLIAQKTLEQILQKQSEIATDVKWLVKMHPVGDSQAKK